MATAAEGLDRYLEDVTFREPRLRVWTSVEARPVTNAEEVRGLLVRQMTAPVRWEETVRGLAALGATQALEVGPGRVLTGLLRRTVPSLPGLPAGDTEGLARARELCA
jgi:[acyl-carrier-protein] S-malonyltransferase